MELNQTQAQINQIIQQAQQAAAAQVAATQAITGQVTQATNGPKAFDANELVELSTIREAYEQTTVALGQLEMQKRELSKNEKRINERLVAIEAQEKVFLDKIVAKYGEGTFDINTGVFTPKS